MTRKMEGQGGIAELMDMAGLTVKERLRDKTGFGRTRRHCKTN
jgi:hypothetical protein